LLKVVIDANVWISALLNPGTAREIIGFLKKGQFHLIYSAQMFDELLKVTDRQKFAKKLSAADKADLIDLIKQRGILIAVKRKSEAISRDPKDDQYLACAQIAGCEFIVSGDMDLLALKEHAGARIVTPAQFLKIMSSIN